MFGLLPIEGSWFLRFEKRFKEFFSNHPVPLSKEGNLSNHPVNFSKITPFLFTIKEGDFSKITPSLFTLKEGSTSHPDPLTLRGEGGNRPTRCSEPLRSKVGGPSKVFAMLCGMGPPYYSSLIRTALLQLADWGGMATICYSLMIGGAWGTNC